MIQKIPFPDDRQQRQILFGLYILFIAVVSLFPADSSALPVKHIDKVGHYFAYVLMAVLANVSFEKRNWRVSAVFLSFIIAILLEWGQRFVPGRQVTLTDELANMLGLLTGILLYWYNSRRAATMA